MGEMTYMKVVEKRKSQEPCTESGWEAFDFILEEPIDEEVVLCLAKIEGSFLYLKNLKKPFFKIENHNYVIKGVLGDCFFRVAAHRDWESWVNDFQKEIT